MLLFQTTHPTRVYLDMIIRRKDGYFVISEKGKKKLGGPYKKRKDAELRLQQVEYFKQIGR